MNAIESLNRRVAALELSIKASARASELGFANMRAQIDDLRRDLPDMIASAMREVLAEREGLAARR